MVRLRQTQRFQNRISCLKEFWRKNEHFADLFNAFLFKGQQVLKAGDLEETDTDISGILKETIWEKRIKNHWML